MKEQDRYETPKSSAVMRFLWSAAGGDRYFLERGTYSDQIKYMCLGGIIFATGAMAGLAGGYAFYTIFSPKGFALNNNNVDLATVILSIIFGVIWGLMIFNIDRFIVTSTGKGDGTEKITWDELKSAIPRIIMGAIIAITISKPIEIRMFQTEIGNELYKKQQKLITEFENTTNANFKDRLKVVEDELGNVGKQKQDLIERIKKAERDMQDNLMGRVKGIAAGNGKLTQAIQSRLDDLYDELNRFNEINKVKIKTADTKRQKLLSEKDLVLKNNEKVAQGLDGLLERIKLAHKVAGFWISLFITLLFMVIELTPIFFKLMLTKTPYDYLTENREALIKANDGIEVRYDLYKDKKGQERHLIINHEFERMIYEKIKITEIQKELTDYAIEKYKAQEKEKIDSNLEDYIKKIETNNNNDEETTG
jgi:hypothetical protein